MIVNFTKMHSLGNDFIIIDGITTNVRLYSKYLQQLANRHTGVGCDQTLILEPPTAPDADFYYKIYNADGNEAEQCINGARCAARFAADNGLADQKIITADCLAGRINFTIKHNQSIISDLGVINPVITSIDFSSTVNQQHNDLLPIIGSYTLSVGNPHIIYLMDATTSDQPLTELYQPCYNLLAENIINHPERINLFPHGVNIGLVALAADNNLYLRVFERGTGETLSCGSNAMAAYLAAKQFNLIGSTAKTIFKLGCLTMTTDEHHNLTIDGAAHSVFTGKFKL